MSCDVGEVTERLENELCLSRKGLKKHLSSTVLKTITYKQWMQIEKRTSLETLVKPTDELISILFEKRPKLLQHSFLASQ